ncbi:MAG: thioredoxin 1 [Patescibacteria group bacterium]|nr:thioredoxin 1 [Patescibacteria group bacterium]
MEKVKDINASNFQEEVLDNKLPILVDFWAPWCGPCLMMAPILDELNSASENKFSVMKLNVEEEENVALAQHYEIRSIPNMKLFKNGKVIHEFVGVTDSETLKTSILNAIKREE